MTIWSLTTTENGLFTSLHQTEQDCYHQLVTLWFPDGSEEFAADRAAALEAIGQGIQPCIDWFTRYDNYAVARHDPQWCVQCSRPVDVVWNALPLQQSRRVKHLLRNSARAVAYLVRFGLCQDEAVGLVGWLRFQNGIHTDEELPRG